MRLVSLHSDYIVYKPVKKAIENAEDVDLEEKRIEECVVIFTSMEKGDTEGTVEFAVKEVDDICSQVNCNRVVVYPWVHLSDNPLNPMDALKLLKLFEQKLSEKYETYRAPFGWYKSFSIKVKGHPLSELSRKITGEEVPVALKKEEELISCWYVIDLNGNLVPVDEFDFSKYPSLEIFYNYETKGTRRVTVEPVHIKLMRELELVDYESGSDPGNYRWYPKGVIVKRLLERYVTDLIIDYGGMEVETPLMYDYNHPNLASYLNRFPARQYIVKSGEKEFFLRFAACFGQYLIKKDMTVSYKQLPVRLYELTRYSFRREQSGEIAGLRRLRAFTMPDMHTLCKDMEQAWEEYINQVKLCKRFMDSLGVPYDIGLRMVKDFFEEHKERVLELVKILQKPILLELWEQRFFYFVAKIEFSVNDTTNKAATLSTVQIDVENAERFGITYVDENNQKKYPIILHASISGGIERDIWAVLESEWMKKDVKKPEFPFWLAPIQVRVIPVSDRHMEYAENILKELKSHGFRADLDDISDSLAKKIRRAEKEWISFVVVVGDKEVENDTLSVRPRNGEAYTTSLEDFISQLEELRSGYPNYKLCLPERLSLRPRFR